MDKLSTELDHIYDVTTKMQNSTLAHFLTTHWLDNLLRGHPSAFYEASALVLIMATNLERVDVKVGGWRRFTRTPQILTMPWKIVDAHPFSKVTKVSVGGPYGKEFEVALLPSVVELTVQGTGADKMPSRELGHFTVSLVLSMRPPICRKTKTKRLALILSMGQKNKSSGPLSSGLSVLPQQKSYSNTDRYTWTTSWTLA
jgi:hypothetical protein